MSIVPKRAASLRSLTVTMAVMCYLATLAVGALILVDRAVQNWTGGLQGEATVQIRETKGVDFESEVSKATAILKATNGVRAIDVLDQEAGAELLRPWLGDTSFETLPIPRLIRVQIDQSKSLDFVKLEKDLKQGVKGVTLDTHQRWVSELARTAGTLSFLAWVILSLICLSAIAMVIFATRAVLAANKGTVEVLQMVGATDGFIVTEMNRHFLASSLGAGILGSVVGLVTFVLIGNFGGFGAAASGLIYLPTDGSHLHYLALAMVPVLACVIAVVTARITMLRMLRDA